MLNNTSNTIIYRTYSCYPSERCEVILPDSMEGDICFYFIVEHAKDNQTIINVTSSYSAEVIISTGPYKKTRSLIPIRIGTYQGNNELYLDYEVLPIDNIGKHEVIISFIIKRS